jgi:hypothetical protein
VSEHDDFEYRDFDRRLTPALKANRLPPIVPRLLGETGHDAPRAREGVARPVPRAPLRGRVMALLFWGLALWGAYAVAHMTWFVFLSR